MLCEILNTLLLHNDENIGVFKGIEQCPPLWEFRFFCLLGRFAYEIFGRFTYTDLVVSPSRWICILKSN